MLQSKCSHSTETQTIDKKKTDQNQLEDPLFF